MSSMEISPSSVAERTRYGRMVKARKSRITNGRDLLAGIDQRTATFRRYRDLIEAIVADQGGDDQCSESRKQLIRRFAACSVLAEQAEAKLAAGQEIDVATHALLVSSLVRLSSRIGIDRRQRNVTPTLSEYLETIEDTAADEAEQRIDGAGQCQGEADEK
jgi:hypothetical protein